MKKVLPILIAFVFALTMSFNSSAQLENGSIAPDWTMTDIDGNEHHLYDYLDQGYTVFLEFSATWCGPCWSFHTSGTLKDLYEFHGPAGMDGVDASTTDDVMVIFIEGDPQTTSADLNGTGGNTQGDWVEGVPFPIIDDASQTDIYQIAGWPTLYRVCPDRTVFDTPFPFSTNYNTHYDGVSNCAVATSDSDGSLVEYTGITAACSSDDVEIRVTLQNLGFDELTEATITVSGDADIEYNWTGSLMTYEIEEVTVGTVAAGDLDIDIEVSVAEDGDASNNAISAQLELAEEASTHIRVEINTDNWPGETTWELRDDSNALIASGGPYGDGTPATQDPESVTEDHYVPGAGCYTFTMFDAFGDGMNGSQWPGGVDGSYTVRSIDEDESTYSTIASYDGSYDFEEIENPFESSVVVSVDDQSELVSEFVVYPNPTNSVANIYYSLAEASEVSLVVYNTLGAVVFNQDMGTVPTGMNNFELSFDGMDAGLYFVNLTANDRVVTKKVTVTK